MEHFLLRFSSPQGRICATGHHEAVELIVNQDPLQKMCKRWSGHLGTEPGWDIEAGMRCCEPPRRQHASRRGGSASTYPQYWRAISSLE